MIGRGWIINTPSSRDSEYDLLADLGNGVFEKIQVKKMRNHILPRGVWRKGDKVSKDGKNRNSIDYAERGIDWLVGVDVESKKIFYYHISSYSKKPKKFKVTSPKHPPYEFPINGMMRHNCTGKVIDE